MDEEGNEENRKSKDGIKNKEGEDLLRRLNDMGLRILNENTERDEEGEYTYIGGMGSCVIDHGIVNEEGRRKTRSLKISGR